MKRPATGLGPCVTYIHIIWPTYISMYTCRPLYFDAIVYESVCNFISWGRLGQSIFVKHVYGNPAGDILWIMSLRYNPGKFLKDAIMQRVLRKQFYPTPIFSRYVFTSGKKHDFYE